FKLADAPTSALRLVEPSIRAFPPTLKVAPLSVATPTDSLRLSSRLVSTLAVLLLTWERSPAKAPSLAETPADADPPIEIPAPPPSDTPAPPPTEIPAPPLIPNPAPPEANATGPPN